MHIVMHAFGKITLFFAAGAIAVAAHKTEISQMQGLGRTMPVTMFAFLVGSLAVIGVPPSGGVWSKWFLGLGTLEAGHILLLVVLLASSLLNIGYLLEIPARAFFGRPDPAIDAAGMREAPLPMLGAMVLTATATILLFVYPDPLYRLLRMIVEP